MMSYPLYNHQVLVLILFIPGFRETCYHTTLFTKKDKSVVMSPVSLRTLDGVGVELELELELRT